MFLVFLAIVILVSHIRKVGRLGCKLKHGCVKMIENMKLIQKYLVPSLLVSKIYIINPLVIMLGAVRTDT